MHETSNMNQEIRSTYIIIVLVVLVTLLIEVVETRARQLAIVSALMWCNVILYGLAVRRQCHA